MTEQKKKTWENRYNRPRKTKKKKSLKHAYWMKCSDCGLTQQVFKREVRSSSRVRCIKCGGPVNFKKEM